MKNISLIALITITLFVSCDLDDRIDTKQEYYIQNNSGHNVAIATVGYNLKKDSLIVKTGDVLRLDHNGSPIRHDSDMFLYFDDLPALAFRKISLQNTM